MYIIISINNINYVIIKKGGIYMLLVVDSVVTFMRVFWVVVIIGTLIIELATPNLNTIWFSIGGVIALILNYLGVTNPWIQLIVFLLVSTVLLFSVGKIAKKYLKKTPEAQTNIDAAIGKEILITKDANSHTSGEGKYNGLIWSVICNDENGVKKDEYAIILKVEGNKLIVKRK